MHVVGITTTLCCASRRNASKTSSEEATSPTSAIQAMDIVPATPHVGTGTEVIACIAIPGPQPPAPHVVHLVVHPLGDLHVPKGTPHPTGTTRML